MIPPVVNVTKNVIGDDNIFNYGDEAQYLVVVTNNGDVVANDVVVTDTLPDGLTVINGTISYGGVLSGKVITWVLNIILVIILI